MKGLGLVGWHLFAAVIAWMCVSCASPFGVDTLQPPSLVVPIDTRLFAADATLVAQIWNGQHLGALANNVGCTASRNPVTGATDVRCPPGVVYQDVSPQTLEFAVRTAGERLEIPLEGVKSGERFRIRIAGPSADGCNTTSGEETSTAGSGAPIRVSLVWETTAKACQ